MKLAEVKTFDQLLPWLASNLDWPVDEFEIAPDTGFDDLTYEYEGKELGLKPEDIAHIREIRQLRPLVTNQPWGIFFVNFEDKKIPVGVLKRILGGLTLRKRQSANKVEQKAWTLHDLLFISSFGKSGERELSFLHFAEENGGKNKTVLKELGWDHQDTQLKLEFVERTLKSNLVWPEDASDADAWRAQWGGAFTSTHGATIRTAKELTRQLAGLASSIRTAAGDVLEFENKNGPLTKIFENFKKTIFHNLTPADFADMYAQTICYGLLAKQIERARSGIDTTTLSADDATLTQGVMQPFLKDLMETFLAVGGRKRSIDFNELGVNEVVELLQAADMTAVLLDFGNRNPHEDPVLHFYEHFLRDYDSIMREQRGVYYTPLPVVRFIVRSVHEILQREFGLPDGLADTTTWEEMTRKNPELSVPKGVGHDTPFVQILDPATGTGTFLVEAIEQIETHLKSKWRKAGRKESEVLALWNEYVPAHLLPRLSGFELMMAPYAIAHIKIGMKLHETGYRPKPEEAPRVRVYLTNTLEEPSGIGDQNTLKFMTDTLAREAIGADEIKSRIPVTVVIGNPPYANYSANLTSEVRRLVDKYRTFKGSPIRERNQLQFERNLQDDMVKFIAVGENFLMNSGAGILGYITNSTMLGSLSLRGMREHVSSNFNSLFEINLHGGVNELFSSDQRDENVFNISQAVAIHIYTKSTQASALSVTYSSIVNTREEKYKLLRSASTYSLEFRRITPDDDNCAFLPNDGTRQHESVKIDAVFAKFGAGIKTNRDAIAINFTPDALLTEVFQFDSSLEVKERAHSSVQPILYRPFDCRFIYYHENVIASRSLPTMQHFLRGANVGLVASSTWTTPQRFSVGTTDRMVEMKSGTHDRGTSVFPLYRYEGILGNEPKRVHNFTKAFVNKWKVCAGVGIGVANAASTSSGINTVEDVYSYIYAVCHSPSYRRTYMAALSQGFPLVLFPGSQQLFYDLASIGARLGRLHLLDVAGAPSLSAPDTRFVSKGTPRVERGFPRYENGKVMINSSCWFEDVTPDVWNFHIGGYQVCEKWLKDRAGKGGKNPAPGRVLSPDDILHYRRITVALRETIRLMAEIDQVIDRHGGWPDAFVAASANKAEAAQ